MTPEFRTRLQRVLDAHDRAFEALRESDDALHEGTNVLPELIDVQDRIYASHGRAIDAALAANRSALELLRDIEE